MNGCLAFCHVNMLPFTFSFLLLFQFFSIAKNTVMKIFIQKPCSSLIILLRVIPKSRITGQKLSTYWKLFMHLIIVASRAECAHWPSHQGENPCLFAGLPTLIVTGCKRQFPIWETKVELLAILWLYLFLRRVSSFHIFLYALGFFFCNLLV